MTTAEPSSLPNEPQIARFEVDGQTYEITIAPHLSGAKGTVEVTFSATTQEGGTRVMNLGLTGAGHPFRVLGIVINGLRGWAARHRPAGIAFSAVEPNRRSLYARIVRRFAVAEGYRLAVDGPLGEPLAAGEFHLVRFGGPTATPGRPG